MPHSLRAELSKMRHKGYITDDEYKKYIRTLDRYKANYEEAYQQGYEDAMKKVAELDSAYQKGYEDGVAYGLMQGTNG